jgi:hypothetical protein
VLDGVVVDGHDIWYWYGSTVPGSLIEAVESSQSSEKVQAMFVSGVEKKKVEERQQAEREQARGRKLTDLFRESVDIVIEEKAKEIGMEWTASLLTSTFALPSGQRVSWGQATREQHLERIEMLSHNAAANAEAATRHQIAVNSLDEAGAECLDKLS